jgi:hypothetical protein
MVHLGDEAQVEARFDLFGDSAKLEEDRCMVCAERTIARKLFWTHRPELLGDDAQVEAHFGHLEMVLILMQDRCTICVERTIGSEIGSDAPDGTPRWQDSSGSSFRPIWRSANLDVDSCTICAECTIASEVVLDAPKELLGDMGHVESYFGPFGDSVTIGARYGARFAPNVP